MAMTRSELRTHVLANLGNNRTNLNSLVNDWLDWALEDIASVRNWKDMKVLDTDSLHTVTGRVWYSFPKEVKDITNVRYVNDSLSRSLVYKDWDMFQKEFPHPDQDGQSDPVYYTLWGDNFQMYPLASESNKAIELMLVKWPDVMEADGDEFPLPRLEKAAIARASAYAFGSLRDMKMSSFHDGKFWSMLKRQARSEGTVMDWTLVYASERLSGRWGRSGLSVPPLGSGETLDTVNV